MALGDIERAERTLHTTYGPLVRIAPTELICSDPSSIPLLYRDRDPLQKAPWYEGMRSRGISPQADLFTERDEVEHARYRKVVGPVYQMRSVLKNEAAMDECISMFVQRLGEFAAKKEELDLGHWLELFAFDVIGYTLSGRSLGFVETGTDVGRWIESKDQLLPFTHVAGQGPSYMVVPLMILAFLAPGVAKAFKGIGDITVASKRLVQEKMDVPVEEVVKGHDIVSQLFGVMHSRGSEEGFTQREIHLEAWVSIIAGADSTAIGMRATLYYLMKSPERYKKAVGEVRAADARGELSTPIRYAETMAHLPYVCACIKEATRLFPSFALRMSRVAPAQGLEICGHFIPAGHCVGMNPAVVHYDKGVFGQDADMFRPERWLECSERSLAMDKAILLFGAGTRTCIGQSVRTSCWLRRVEANLDPCRLHSSKCTNWYLRF
jgi:cytochrome P450